MQFIDLAAQQTRIKAQLDARIQVVLKHGRYIMGPEVTELERALSAFCGARHSITCANGTDALQLALMALGIRAGDAVICPAFTFAATAEVVPAVGAIPLFADIEPATFNLSPGSLKRTVAYARELGLRPAAVMAVDLFGLPADYDAVGEIARREGLLVIADCAQSFGSTYRGRAAGSAGDVATTSFFPSKPLGCYGDGGAMFTADDEVAARVRSLRVHGKGAHKYDNERIGLNSRLDTLQAAILLEKLTLFPDELTARRRIAARYTAGLSGVLATPAVPEGLLSSWAQYTVRVPPGRDRGALRAALAEQGVPTAVYYPQPLHMQTAYRGYPRDPAGLPASEAAASEVLSLPMHPYLAQHEQDQVMEAVQRAFNRLLKKGRRPPKSAV